MTDGRNDDTATPAINVTPAPAIPPSAAARKARRGESWRLGRLGGWVLAALVLALVIVGSLPYWAPPLVDRLPWGVGNQRQQQVAALQAQLDQAQQDRASAQQQLARTKATQTATPTTTPASTAAETAPATAVAAANPPVVTALAGRITALEQRPAPTPTPAATPAPDIGALLAPVNQELGRLDQRLDAIETRLTHLATDASAMAGSADRMLMVAVAELRGTVESSRPYAGELAAVEALAGNRPEIIAGLKPLEATAASGLPSIAVLDERFTGETAPAILRATAGAPADESWGNAILARLRGLVVIRRIGTPSAGTDTTPSDPTADAVAHAQAALDKGDLAGAVAALKALPDTAAPAATAWLASAQQRLAAETALDGVTQRIADHLAQTSRVSPIAAESH